ncbi:MAG: hypothetical protein R2705_15560 [Ilumatobacteraceae bacterium]
MDATNDVALAPTLTGDLVQQRRFAVAALALGSRTASLRHFEQAVDTYALDWVSSFCAAWLRSVGGNRRDVRASLEHARNAVLAAKEAPAELRRRRTAESLVLVARADRAPGRRDAARRSCERALELDPVNRGALTELLVLAASADDSESIREATESLLRFHPAYALRIVWSPELRSHRSLVRSVLRARLDHLTLTFGGTVPTGSADLQAAKNAVRDAYDPVRRKVSAAIADERRRASELYRLIPAAWRQAGEEFADRDDVGATKRQIEAALEIELADLTATRHSYFADPVLQRKLPAPTQRVIVELLDDQARTGEDLLVVRRRRADRQDAAAARAGAHRSADPAVRRRARRRAAPRCGRRVRPADPAADRGVGRRAVAGSTVPLAATRGATTGPRTSWR